MIRVIELLVAIGAIVTIGSYLRLKIKSKQESKRLARLQVKEALEVNSRYRLENVLILHDNFLDKKTKSFIKSRIAELFIKEDDLELEENFNKNLDKRKSAL